MSEVHEFSKILVAKSKLYVPERYKKQVSHRVPTIWSDLQTLLLSGTFCSVQVNWHSIICKENSCSNYAENIRRSRKN